LVGVSGGGKTTLSKMVSGIITPTSGSISVRVGDEWVDLTVLGSNGRGRATKYIGILHQEYTLYPSRSVLENLTEAIGLSLPFDAGRKEGHPYPGDRWIHRGPGRSCARQDADELSEGERHRVAMAQVLIKEPRIVILDEPTGTMDAITKIEVTKSILKRPRGTWRDILHSESRHGLREECLRSGDAHAQRKGGIYRPS